MLDVCGFRGLTFDTGKVLSQNHVITPPYDVISPAERELLAKLSPYSMVHLLLPRERDGLSRYESAAAHLETWIEQGILVQDPEPSFYLLRQHFVDLDGAPRVRRAFFGVTRLPKRGEKTILGHERTFNKPVEDRLRLTQATRANLGAVFVLYADPEQVLAPFFAHMDAHPPAAAADTLDGVKQEFWRVPHSDAVTAFFRDKILYIADGHHRFQTAQTYRDALRQQKPSAGPQPYDYVLMGFVCLDDPGLKIYPPHRLVPKPDGFDLSSFLKALDPWFEVLPVCEDLPGHVEQDPSACVIGVAIHGEGDYLLRWRDRDRTALLGDDRGPAWRDLDVALLHRGIIEGILGMPPETQFAYVKSAGQAMHAAHSGSTGLAFILRATRADQIRACAEAGEPMPQKSTYFFPKLPSGVVIHRLI